MPSATAPDFDHADHLAAGATTPRSERHVHQPELDGIRGLAILAVLLSHAVSVLDVLPRTMPHPKWMSGVAFALVPGWGGVDLFFTLSGFLITGILLRSAGRPGYFQSFYGRRMLRIFPVYYLALGLSLLAAAIWPAVAAILPPTNTQKLSYFLYLQNWPIFWAGVTGLSGVWGAYWSLAVEEQFYLIWPTIVRWSSVRTLYILCAAGFLLGTPVRALVIHYFTGLTVGLMHFPIARLDGLFIGAALALYRFQKARPAPLRWGYACLAIGAAMFLEIAFRNLRELPGMGPHMLTYGITSFAFMSAGLLIASQHPLPRLQAVLCSLPLRILGRYSYGMYIYHLFLFAAVRATTTHFLPQTHGELRFIPALLCMAFCILASVGIAALSFELFERRLLALKRYFPSAARP